MYFLRQSVSSCGFLFVMFFVGGCVLDYESGDPHSSAVSNSETGATCTPAPAYDFVYPVLGSSAISAELNTTDPRDDDWYVWNCFANTCYGGNCLQGDHREIHHSGEDFNLTRRLSSGGRTCDASVDIGASVHAVANGVVVLVRNSASLKGYVVVRHDLPAQIDITPYLPIGATIPDEEQRVESVYSLYLHIAGMRVSEGDCVRKGQLIGRIARLGGRSHLHFEINRSVEQYRRLIERGYIAGTLSGYYRTPQDLANFGHLHPSRFIHDHRLVWHPPGTLVEAPDGYYLLVREGGRTVRRNASSSNLTAWRYVASRAVQISRAEAECYDVAEPFPWPPATHVYRTSGDPTVYRVNSSESFREPFISAETFFSWGYDFTDVERDDSDSYSGFPIRDTLRFRDGSLFRTLSDPRVYVVSQGRGRHIPSLEMLSTMGYQAARVYFVGDGTEDVVTESRGLPINFFDLHRCSNRSSHPSTHDCETCSDAVAGYSDSGGATCPDADGDGYYEITCGGSDCDDSNFETNPGALEICDGHDNNCNDVADDGIDFAWSDEHCGDCATRCSGTAHCVSGACVLGGCLEDSQCDDSVACTVDTCTAGTCRFEPDDARCESHLFCSAEYGCTHRDTDGDGVVDVDDCAPLDSTRHPFAPEICNGIDDDCDSMIDEGVQNACGTCGSVPTEICDGFDNDCDGMIDEEVRNACGLCGPVPLEVCNHIDDDCDGTVDEGVCPSGTGPPPSSGHTVRFRFVGYSGSWQFGFDQNPDWYVPITGELDRTYHRVSPGWHITNGEFPGPRWMCEEWPLGSFRLPYGTLQVWVDGVLTAVYTWHDPSIPGGVGCNLRFCVGGC